MIKSIDEKQGGIEIDLTGPDGNSRGDDEWGL